MAGLNQRLQKHVSSGALGSALAVIRHCSALMAMEILSQQATQQLPLSLRYCRLSPVKAAEVYIQPAPPPLPLQHSLYFTGTRGNRLRSQSWVETIFSQP